MGSSDRMDPAVLQPLRRGVAIPAHPLALTASRKLDERRQVALTRYYCDAGAGASVSRDPPAATGRSAYTLPVENTTMRLRRKRSATFAGTTVFIAQVSSGLSDEPNFRPAR